MLDFLTISKKTAQTSTCSLIVCFASLPLESTKVDGCTIHNVNEGDLVGCFEGVVTEKVIDAIAAMDPVRVVFRDSSFTEAANKMNLFELFKQKCSWTDEEIKKKVRVI